MKYLEELADELFVGPIEAWQPEREHFPIGDNFFGPIELAGQSPTSEWGIWKLYKFSNSLPEAGFKIHVAPKLDDFDAVLKHVFRIASELNLTIKHLSRREYLWALYSKNAPRNNAGKAIVLYPEKTQLDECLRALTMAVQGFEGPPIAGDHRLGTTILHVRYGAFELHRSTYYDEYGNPYILGPDNKWRPDLRESVPLKSDAAYLPEVFKEAPRRESHLPAHYDVISAYSTHPGGGTYRGFDNVSNQPIVLKRGIRHIGVDGSGVDAAQRVVHECAILRELGITDTFRGRLPEVLDSFWVDSSYFMVMRLVPGVNLYEWTASNNPIYKFESRTSPGYCVAANEFCDRVFSIGKQTRQLIKDLFNEGIIHNDIQPGNVIVDSHGKIALIDFEGSTNGADSGIRGLSWVYGQKRSFGYEVDLEAVSQLKAYALWPPVVSAHLDPEWSVRFRTHLLRYFPMAFTEIFSGHNASGVSIENNLLDTYETEKAYANAVCHFFESGLGLPYILRTGSGHSDNRQIASFGNGLLSTLALSSNAQEVRDAQAQFTSFISSGPTLPLRTHDLSLINGVGLTAPTLKMVGHGDAAQIWGNAYVDTLQNIDLSKVSWNLETGLAGYLYSLLRLKEEGVSGDLIDSTLDLIADSLQHRADTFLAADKEGIDVSQNLGLITGSSGVALALHCFGASKGVRSSIPSRLIEWELSTYQQVHGARYYTDETNRFRPYLDRGNAGLLVAAAAVLGPETLRNSQWQPVIKGIGTALGVTPGLMTGAAGILLSASVLDEDPDNSFGIASLVENLKFELGNMFITTSFGQIPAGNLSRRISLDGSTGAGGAVLAYTGGLKLFMPHIWTHGSSSYLQERADA